MFAKSILVAVAASSLATATTTVWADPPAKTPIPVNQCNTGPISCCNTVDTAGNLSNATTGPQNLLGVIVQGVDVLVGLGCTPISVVGIGSGDKCEQKPVCCTHNNYQNSLINIGCTPIEV